MQLLFPTSPPPPMKSTALHPETVGKTFVHRVVDSIILYTRDAKQQTQETSIHYSLIDVSDDIIAIIERDLQLLRFEVKVHRYVRSIHNDFNRAYTLEIAL